MTIKHTVEKRGKISTRKHIKQPAWSQNNYKML